MKKTPHHVILLQSQKSPKMMSKMASGCVYDARIKREFHFMFGLKTHSQAISLRVCKYFKMPPPSKF